MNAQSPLRVVIVDDHPLFRHGVRTLFLTTPQLDLVGEASNGEEAIALAESLLPDVMLMDIRMPGASGIEITRRIAARHPSIRILMLTMFEDDASVFNAMRSGAKGYILKDADKDDLLRAISAVGKGEAIFSPNIAARMIEYFSTAKPAAREEAFPELSAREREVLYLMTEGVSNADIASRLDISGKTVSNYIANILNKLQVSDRQEAMRLARRTRFDNG